MIAALVLSAALGYDAQARIARLDQALAVLQRTPEDVLGEAYRYVALYERGSCESDNQRLRVECLITAVHRFCQKRPAAQLADCALYGDVIVTNLLAERQLVTSDERYDIMKKTRDWRREMWRRIRRIQGALAAELALRRHPAPNAPLGRDIDAFCLETADQTNLSWQICAAALVWFIGTGSPDTEVER